MPLPFTLTQLTIVGGLCLAAAAWDLARRRIPNLLVAAVLVDGLWAQATAGGGPLGPLGGLAAAGLVLALLFPLWTRGGIGGGDVKLAFAAAVWVGLPRLPVFLLAGAMAGGLVAAACYLLSKRDARRAIRGNLWTALVLRQIPDAAAARAGAGRITVPYALAIDVALFAALFVRWTPGF